MAGGANAVLSHKQIVQRRQETMAHILSTWEQIQGAYSYTIQCPCEIDCDCIIAQNDSPRITLPRCLYVGELDYFIVEQPFRELYGFEISWYCNTCDKELACGMPT